VRGRKHGSRSWALLGRLLLMLIALAPSKARADEHRDMLLLTVAATAEESARLEAVTHELLAPLEVRVEIRRVPRIDLTELREPPARACLARAWIALLGTGSARLYLAPSASDRLLVRDVPGDAKNPELVREELGHILQAAVEGIKAGEEVGELRPEALQQAAPSAPPLVSRERPPAPPAARSRRPRLRVGARYELRFWGEGARFDDGPGLVVALAGRVGLELGGYYRRPLRVERAPVGARFEAISLRALFTLEPRDDLRLGVGLGADLAHVRPLASADQPSVLADASLRKLAMARLQATYGYRVARACELQLSAGADFDASGTRYVFQREAGELTVLRPARVRPFVSFGVAVP
jgi:hypothetical protein